MKSLLQLNINTKTEDVDLSGYDFELKELKELSKKLENNKIRSLDLSNNSLPSQSLNLIVKALEKNKNLEILDLSENGLSSKGMKSFSKILKKHPSLTTLDFSDNQIHDQGIQQLMDGLKNNSILENLYITSCSISNEGVISISNFLKNKTQKLTRLDLSRNIQVSEIGFQNLFKSLEINETLKVLKISNMILESSIDHLIDFLKKNKNLIQLTANNCGLNQFQIYKILEGIKENPSLRILHLEGNDKYFDSYDYINDKPMETLDYKGTQHQKLP